MTVFNELGIDLSARLGQHPHSYIYQDSEYRLRRDGLQATRLPTEVIGSSRFVASSAVCATHLVR